MSNYGSEDYTDKENIGAFINPNSGQSITIPGAGCARFWIAFEHGKNLCPIIEGSNLNVLAPGVQQLAMKCFNVEFIQGCWWG